MFPVLNGETSKPSILEKGSALLRRDIRKLESVGAEDRINGRILMDVVENHEQ